MPDEGMVSVEVDNGVTGTLSLVGGRLAEYRVRFDGNPTNVAEFRKQLVGKFGKATREVASGATTDEASAAGLALKGGRGRSQEPLHEFGAPAEPVQAREPQPHRR